MASAHRRIDDLGRVVIPRELRRELHIEDGDELHLEIINNTIVITKSTIKCVCCGRQGDSDEVKDYKDISLCKQCAEVFTRKFDLDHDNIPFG